MSNYRLKQRTLQRGDTTVAEVVGDVLQKAANFYMGYFLSLIAGNQAGADCFLKRLRLLAKEFGVSPEELERRATDCVAIRFLS